MKTIIFYEMSNIDSEPYVISNAESFYSMCREWGIKLTKTNINYIDRNDTVYAICKMNKPELVLSTNYKQLRKNFYKSKTR